MSTQKLQNLRRQAYAKQGFRCFYCRHPIWEDDPEQFVRCHGLRLGQAKLLKSTAEHLVAQQDGGQDTADNIVAACYWCNSRRHKGRSHTAPDPASYKARISQRVAKGKWHPVYAGKLLSP